MTYELKVYNLKTPVQIFLIFFVASAWYCVEYRLYTSILSKREIYFWKFKNNI